MKNASSRILALMFCLPSAAAFCDGEYSPPVRERYADTLLWGDTHVHTYFSLDALLYNNFSIGPDEAYRFARGEQLVSNSGQPVSLRRPLDFLVVSDHVEFMGLSWQLRNPSPQLLADPALAMLARQVSNGFSAEEGTGNHSEHFFRYSKLLHERLGSGREQVSNAWRATVDSAERYNEPGTFSALLGYEWSSNPGGNNLHRVVVFRDDGDKLRDIDPFSSTVSEDPEQLWQWLEQYEESTGGRALAIPHNGNVSNGLMFSIKDFSGQPITAEYARARQRWEPLYEVTQVKGDTETHPVLSPTDEFANFERWDDSNIFFTALKNPEMLEFEYARSSLKNGLKLESSLGVNPFQFGLIGSTDTHTGLSTATENNFWNKISLDEPQPGRATHLMSKKGKFGALVTRSTATISSSGYTGVWAEFNSREQVFDAMTRREVFATTGPRIAVRFFAGWDFSTADLQRPDRDAIGYRKGVPMGALLPGAPAGRSPSLLIHALKDPDGANLDRIQVIKGWRNAKGETKERVYNVAWGPGRTSAADGALPSVGNTVNLASATYLNSIGQSSLETVWTDPEFDPAQHAFYYVRVLEIPTPRWTSIDTAVYGTTLPDEVPAIIQERAYSSPVWYRPAVEAP